MTEPTLDPLAALVRRLRGNPGRIAVIVASFDEPGAPPAMLAAEVRRRVEARLGPEVRARLEEGAPVVEAVRGFLGLLEPDRDERRALADELMEATPAAPGEEALAALCLGEVVPPDGRCWRSSTTRARARRRSRPWRRSPTPTRRRRC